EKVNVGIIKLKLEHDNGLSSYFIRFLFSSNLRKMEKELDEEIRIERIRRKI
ncbi:hypothetical protein DJ526_09620, partial [Sulfolobus sp. A20-N-G8]